MLQMLLQMLQTEQMLLPLLVQSWAIFLRTQVGLAWA